MIKWALSLIVVGGLFVFQCGCAGRAPTPAGEGIAIGACNPFPCARMAVSDVPELPESLPSSVREKIATHVEEVLYAPLDDEASELSRASLVAQLKARQDEVSQISDATLDWILERNASILFANAEVVTIAVTNVGYLGGAHGFHDRTLLCFDAHDGKKLSLAELIGDASSQPLGQIAEAEFRRARGITPDRSLADEGFFVSGGEPFSVTENFGIVEQGVLLHYNPYEIGPYVMGDTEVILPRDAVAPLLKQDKISHLFDSPAANG
jgi:hypothetical protein